MVQHQSSRMLALNVTSRIVVFSATAHALTSTRRVARRAPRTASIGIVRRNCEYLMYGPIRAFARCHRLRRRRLSARVLEISRVALQDLPCEARLGRHCRR